MCVPSAPLSIAPFTQLARADSGGQINVCINERAGEVAGRDRSQLKEEEKQTGDTMRGLGAPYCPIRGQVQKPYKRGVN